MRNPPDTLSSEATTSLTFNQRISDQIAGDGCAKPAYNYRRLRKTTGSAQPLLRQLACDLDRTEEWQWVVKALAPIIQAKGADFDKLTLLGSTIRRKSAALFVGPRCSAQQTDDLLKDIWDPVRVGRAVETDLPGTLRRDRLV